MNINTETAEDNSFAQFPLQSKILQAIDELGYETPSAIQKQTIPILLEGKDLVGQAQTGTGKTAAFSLPMLEQINPKSKKVQALILTPTRELAIQVAEAVHSYAKHLGKVKILPVYGGQSISQQIRHLKKGVQIVVGTPGRVMDHLRRETTDISDLKMMILDEADEMLRMGFIEDVEWILSHTPETRQTALFSATMPKQIRRIAEKYLTNPVDIHIKQKTLTVPAIEQYFINLSARNKTDALTKLLEIWSTPDEAILIFLRTKLDTERLTNKLQARGYAAETLNGDMNQTQRENVIKRLKSKRIEIVVATDVAARGLDVEHITTVINYDMPSDTESYVHRIGRTGRAGRKGKTVLFVTQRQRRMMRDIEHYTKQKIEKLNLPTQADVIEKRSERLKDKIKQTLQTQDLELYQELIIELIEEEKLDILDLAAAATYLSASDKKLEVVKTPQKMNFSFSEEGMVQLFINVGRKHRVSPGDIVGAIANEGDISGKAIGAIDVNETYTLVDVPQQYVEQILLNMRKSRVRKRNMNIRIASDFETNKSSNHKSLTKKKKRRRKPKRRKNKSPGPFDKFMKRKRRKK